MPLLDVAVRSSDVGEHGIGDMLTVKLENADDAMDWLTFISSVVGSLAWPVAAFAIAFIFRKQIALLVDRIRRMSLGDNSIEFSDRLDKVEAEAEASSPDPINSSADFLDERTSKLIALSPAAAILDAWKPIDQRVTQACMALHEHPSPTHIRRAVFSARIKTLLEAGQITQSTYAVLTDLQRLRNIAVHADDVSAADAIRFMSLAKRVELLLTGSDARPDQPAPD